jgi:DNA-binding Lrp family transcriptional regulator
MEGVAGIRSHLVTRQFEATGRWRLGVLGGRQVRRLREASQPPSATGARPFGTTDRALFRALSIDGRSTHAEIAEMIGLSARTVQRRITTLMSSGEIAFRCDVARSLTGWPSAALLWLNVPDDRLDEAGRVLGRRPEVRTRVALADNSNLLLSVGLRSIPDLHELLVEILRDAPYARILDRNIVLRQEKLYRRIVDPAGRSVEATPSIHGPTGTTSERVRASPRCRGQILADVAFRRRNAGPTRFSPAGRRGCCRRPGRRGARCLQHGMRASTNRGMMRPSRS